MHPITESAGVGSEKVPVQFRVDTHVFRELGAFLVGRDSTALAELIKNSYDADATDVFVFGEHLEDDKRSRITVTDNGVGMNQQTFTSGFLTLASRGKSSQARFTALFGRRFTGAKGIGRLAAHKLARQLAVDSLPDPLGTLSTDGANSNDAAAGTTDAVEPGVHAVLDWDRIEAVQHVDELGSVLLVEPSLVPIFPSSDRPWGTRVTLDRLRRAWTTKDIHDFALEVQGYEPPPATYAPNAGEAYVSPLLKKGLRLRGENPPPAELSGQRRNTFDIHLEGDFAEGEAWSPLAEDAAQYVLEIDSSPAGVRYGVARTKSFEKTLPEALRTPIEVVKTAPSSAGVHFQARIFMRAGQSARWARNLSGVRVYLEGFRVLPYGEPGDDWLGTDSQYVQRGRELISLGDKYSDSQLFGSQIDNEGLRTLPATGYIGGVFLTEDASGGLQMLVNREGFVPGPELAELTAIVRRGIDLSTRVRAKEAAAKSRTGRPTTPVTRERSAALSDQVTSLRQMVVDLRNNQDQQDVRTTIAAVERVTEAVTGVSAVTNDLLDELSMIRVLASVGTQLAAFVHELRGLLAVANKLQIELSSAPANGAQSPLVVNLLEDLRRGLERQASFLDDVTSVDARRRRSAQRLAERTNAATLLLSDSAARRRVTFEINIEEELRTRPMFRAELMAILANLLTNAVRAATPPGAESTHRDLHHEPLAGSRGTVGVRAHATDDAVILRISNTGAQIDLATANDWFEPYASTSTDADPVLGQGTGLGLTITRALVAENAGTIEFVPPDDGYSTTIEVTLPHKRSRLRTTR